MMSSKILITCEVRGDTRRYRSLHLVEQLQILGVECQFVHLADINPSYLGQSDWTMVILQRAAYGQSLQKLLHFLSQRNALVFSDFDDLIFNEGMFDHINSPDFSDPIRSYLYKQTMRRINTTLQRSEGSLASTDFLAAQIELTGKPAWVHRNAFSLEMLKYSEEARANKQAHPSTCILGYASGTPTHNKDFEMIKPALMKVMRAYPQTELRLVGPLDPGEGWGDLAERIQRVNLVPWRQLPQVLAGFDVNLAPLVMDNPFAQSKSEIKWMEAAMVETPTIASPTDAFQHAIQQGVNGFLAHDPWAWFDSLGALIEDKNLRQKVGEQAYQDVQRHYHPVERSVQLSAILDEIAVKLRGKPFFSGDAPSKEEILRGTKRRRYVQVWMPPQYDREPSYLKLGLYALQNRGLKVLLLSAWVYFRRLISPLIPF